MKLLSLFALGLSAVRAALDASSFELHEQTLTLDADYSPIILSEFVEEAHHRRTPFAVTPDGKTAYLAYLDTLGTTVHVQKLSTDTFAADGAAVLVPGLEGEKTPWLRD
jgi:hypothetical protein